MNGSSQSTNQRAYPTSDDWGRCFFEEATRHLEDAKVLHDSKRYAAAIASAAKSAELSMKSVLILDGCMGWWDALYKTHTPLTAIQHHPILERHYHLVESYDSTLPARIKELETLEPGRPGQHGYEVPQGKPHAPTEANPEYPFVSASVGTSTGVLAVQPTRPERFFDERDSSRHVDTARALLAAIANVYPEVSAWGLSLP